MPTFIVTAPDGKDYEVSAPEGATEADAIRYIATKLGVTETPKKESTFVGELARSGEKAISAFRTAAGSIGDDAEANKAVLEGVKRGDVIDERYGEGPSLARVGKEYEQKGIGAAATRVVKDAPLAVAGQAANIGTTLAGNLAGGAAGSFFGPAGAVVGSVVGGTVTGFPLMYASNLERQAQEQIKAGKRPEEVDVNRTNAALAAVAQSAADSAANTFTVGMSALSKFFGIGSKAVAGGATVAAQNALLKTAQRTVLKAAGRGAVKGVATEVPTEIAQQVIERAQAGLDLLSEDAIKEYGETAYQTMFPGAVAGAGGNVMERSSARTEVEAAKAAMPNPQSPVDAKRTQENIAYAEALKKERENALKAAEKAPVDASTEVAPPATPATPTELELVPKEGETQGEIPEPTIRGAKEEGSTVIDTAYLDELGFPRNYKAAKSLIGKDSSDPAVISEVAAILQRYSETTTARTPDRLQKIEAAKKRFQGIQPVEETKADPDAELTFQTAKGSWYSVVGEGTQRNKAARADIGHEGDYGIKSPSTKTIYLTPDGANKLSVLATKGGGMRLVISDDGKTAGALSTEGANAGKILESSQTTFSNEPAVGLMPLEVWSDGSRHFGNVITEVRRKRTAKNELPVSGNVGESAVNADNLSGAVKPSVSVADQRAETPPAAGVETAPVDIPESTIGSDTEGTTRNEPAIKQGPKSGGDILAARRVLGEAKRRLDYAQKLYDKVTAVKASTTPEYQTAVEKLAIAQDNYTNALNNAQEIADYRHSKEIELTNEEKKAVGKQVGATPAKDGTGYVGRTSDFRFSSPEIRPTNPRLPAYKLNDAIKLAEALEKFSSAIPVKVYDDVTQAFLTDTGSTVRDDPQAVRAVQDVLAAYADQKKLQEFADGPVQSKEGANKELSYPYNLTDPEVLFEEVRHWVPTHTPEYGKFVDLHVNNDFKLKNTKAAIAAAHKLLAEHTALFNPARNIAFAGDPEVEAATSKAISGKSLADATLAVGHVFKDRGYQQIATKVALRIKRLESVGVKFDLKVVKGGDRAPAALLGSRGLTVTSIDTDGTNVTVYIPDNTTEFTGMHPEYVLHESTHAATASAIYIGQKDFAKGTIFEQFTKDLTNLHQHVVSEMRRRVYSDRTGKGYPLERALLNKERNNFTKDVHELIAWALSNPEAQQLLESIPYKSKRAWTAFVDMIREFFGLPAKAGSAFSEILKISNDLLESDVRTLKNVAMLSGYPLALETAALADPAIDAAVQYLDVVGEKPPRKGLAKRTIEKFGDNPLMAARFYAADNLAVLADKLSRTYGGQRNQFGELNPEQIARQAIDYGKMDTAVKQYGGLNFDSDGLAFASDLTVPNNSEQFPLTHGQPVSEKLLYEKIKEFAKAENITFEHADKNLSTLEYGHREYHLRELNRNIEQEQNLIRASGAPDAQARIDALEEQKIDLAITDNLALDDIERKYQASTEAKIITEMKDAMRFNRIDALVQSGRISEDMAQTWKDAVGYVPFDRIHQWSEAIVSKGRTMRGLAALKALPKISGSQRQVSSTTDSFLQFSSWAVREALNNNALRETARPLEMIGAIRQGTKPAPDAPGSTFSFYKDGVKTEYYSPDPFLFGAFLDGANNSAPTTAVKWLQRAAQLTRVGITATPPFALKQVAEDIVRAMMYSGVDRPLALIPKVLKNFVSIAANEFRGRHSPGTTPLLHYGVTGTYDYETSNTIRNIQIEAGVAKRTLVEKLVHYGEVLARSSDLAVRQAVFDQTRKEGGDMALAEQRARELINFSRRGAAKGITTLARTVPFFNAFIQGTDKLVRIAQGTSTDAGLTPAQARSMFLRRAVVFTGIATTYALMMAGDDEYEKMPEMQRYNNWVLPGTSSLGFTPVVPVPRELGFFFKAIPEAVVNYFATKGTDDEKRAVALMGALGRMGRETFVVNPMAGGYKWIVEWATNHSFFLDRPLESQSQRQLDPSARHGTGTSQFAKDASLVIETYGMGTDKLLGTSPIMLENALRSIFGTTAALTIGVYDAIMNGDRSDRPLHKMMAAQFTGASTFMKDPIGTQFIEELYDMNEKATQVYNTFEKLAKENPERAGEYVKKNMAYYTIRDITNSTIRDLGEMRDMAKIIERAPATSISTEDKRKKIDEIRKAQVERASIVKQLRKVLKDIEDKNS